MLTKCRGLPLSSESLCKFQRDKGSVGVVFMLDIGEDFSARFGPTADPMLPFEAQFVGILGSTQPDVGKRRGQLDRRGGVVGVVDTDSHSILAQELVSVTCKPRFMPKFKRSRNSTRKHRQKCLEFLKIALEEWRQLVQHHSQTALQPWHRTQEVIQSVRWNL